MPNSTRSIASWSSRLSASSRSRHGSLKSSICHGRGRSSSTSSREIGTQSRFDEIEVKTAARYCLDLLRQHNHPAFVLHAFIPPSSLQAYLALQAFSTTLSLIPSTSSSPHLASLRYAFWRQTLTSSLAHTPPKGEPIALLLSASLPHPTQTQTHFLNRLLTSRADLATTPPIPTLSDLESRAENTYSSLLYLLLSTLPHAPSLAADHIVSHLGKAAGLTATLRGLPLLAFPAPPPSAAASAPSAITAAQQQPSVPLPLDVMARCGVREEDVFRHGPTANGLSDAVFEVACRAEEHVRTARGLWESMRKGAEPSHGFEYAGEEGFEDHRGEMNGAEGDGRAALPVFLQGLPTALWLRRLEKCGFDAFDQRLARREWTLPVRAWWALRNRTF